MEWIKDYWYVILLGLVATMFFFGHKTRGGQDESHAARHDEQTDGKSAKGGHSCCH
ncbi:MAG: hypothetical protein JSU90_01100 [Nitrospiraceae bacterium]|nr:MAG: hypothetical protein JSU90_01100 [Nitrospiraceae bacterium]